MLDLAAVKRDQYQEYSPMFWRPAVGARKAHRFFFEKLLASRDSICLVHDARGVINGFIIGTVVSPPPVYDSGGKVCMIDDFVVSDPSLWSTVGVALRDETDRRAAMAGAVLSVTVCGRRDEAKRQTLLESGAQVASEWYVRAIRH
jgi:hypothetical protein